MGAGHYSYDTARMRSVSYAQESREAIFSNNSLDPKMNPKGVVRECCENDEHPDTLPIIIGLDVPFQAGQFEASDELIEKWLKAVYLEGGGGGNGGESTSLVYYFAARHTSCDAISKRGKKGLLITIGDEPNHADYPKSSLSEIFGSGEKSMTSEEIIKEAQQKWEIYHINILDWSGQMNEVKTCWEKLLGDHFISVEANTDTNISNMIARLGVEHYRKQNVSVNAASSNSSNYKPPQML